MIEPSDKIFQIQIDGNAWFEHHKKCLFTSLSQVFHIYGKNWQVTALLKEETFSYVRLQLSKKKIRIGRDSNCDIVYQESTISKLHCEIFMDDDQNKWQVRNLSDVNGTYLNDRRINKKTLKIGDCIRAFGVEIWFCESFLLLTSPSFTKLPVFIVNFSPPVLSKSEIKSNQWPCGSLKPLKEQPKKIGSFTLRIQEMLLFVALGYIIRTQSGTGYYFMLWLSGLRLVLALCKDFAWLCHWLWIVILNRRIMRFNDKLLAYMYSSCEQLERQYQVYGTLLQKDQEVCVRIGVNRKKQVQLHHLSERPHLVIVGDPALAKVIIFQIIYQLLIYYPDIGVMMEMIPPDLYFCLSIKKQGKQVCYIGTKKDHDGDFWLEPITSYDLAGSGYDALLDLTKKRYITKNEAVDIEIDHDFDIGLFSRHYATEKYKREVQWTKQDYLSLIGLSNHTIAFLRQQYHIEDGLIGCIGQNGHENLYLDLNEHRDGPHLLLAGMTGSGKSEWLQSYLFSLAVYYDSSDVQFFFIDFKGGGLSQIFEKMKHTVMVLTDLEAFQIKRAIAALQDEIRQRESYFLEVSRIYHLANLDIHALKRLVRQKKIMRNYAHLLVVVDEFAELKRLYPEMLQSLIRIARIGRSLGIHLILSTQRPSGVVDSQILSNLKAKICLKVSSKQDSYDILGNTQAAFLRDAGEFYLQKEAQGELVYGKAILVDQTEKEIKLLNQDGHVLARQTICSSFNIHASQFLIEQINGISSMTTDFYYKEFPPMEILNGNLYQLGYYDDYIHRAMLPLVYNPLRDGHLLIVGGNKMIYERLLSHYEGYLEIKDIDHLSEIEDGALLVLYDCARIFLADFILWEKMKRRYHCIFIERKDARLSLRFLQDISQQLYFDEQAYFHWIGVKCDFACNLEKYIGIYYLEGDGYLCQICPSAV